MFATATLLLSCDKKANTETASTEGAANKTADSAVSNAVENTNANAETSTNSATLQKVAANNTGAKPTLNPAHGEPYHRCDIQVGAPIDSPAPAQNAAPQMMPQQGPAPTSFNTSPIAPSVAPSSSTLEAGSKPALNPAHGEPHHRCDLQVGAPLI